jgi:hypothetical protein
MITEFKLFEDLINPVESYTSFINLKKYQGQKNVYIHFTDFNKLGVNPNKTHHDPHGIYFYPVNFVFEESSDSWQYGFSMNFYYICKIDTSNFLKINKITFDDIKRFFVKAGLTDIFQKINWGDIKHKRNDYKLWDILECLDMKPSERDNKRLGFQPIFKTLPQVKWNSFFSKLGYDGVIDNKGVVNENEPKQLIVFNPKTIKILEHGENKIQKNIHQEFFEELKNELGCDYFKGEYKTSNGRTLYLAKTKKDDININFELDFSNNHVLFYYIEDNLLKTYETEFNITGDYRFTILSVMKLRYDTCLEKSDKNKNIDDYLNNDFQIMLDKIFKHLDKNKVKYSKEENTYYQLTSGYLKFIQNNSSKKYSIEYYPFEGNYEFGFKFEFDDFDEFKDKLLKQIETYPTAQKMIGYLITYSHFNNNLFQ